MTRSLRRIAALGVLLLGAAVTISAAEPSPRKVVNPAHVYFNLAPMKMICKANSTKLIIDYWFNREEPMALAPLNPQGTLTITASRGGVSNPTTPIGFGPNYIEITYTAREVGHEKVIAQVDYSGYTSTAVAEFEVRHCNYHLKIGGDVTVEAGNDRVYSRTWGETDISVSGSSIEGEMDLNGMFNISPLDEVLTCDSFPSVGWGQVRVTGEILDIGRGLTDIHLDLDYDLVKNFMGGSTTCTNTKTGKDVPFDRKEPDEVDPSEFMRKQLDFIYPQQRIADDYGKSGGSAIYYLTPIP
ncbi:MAG: hypothetical protein WBM17_15375 [Anaerolineales bacterium]